MLEWILTLLTAVLSSKFELPEENGSTKVKEPKSKDSHGGGGNFGRQKQHAEFSKYILFTLHYYKGVASV